MNTRKILASLGSAFALLFVFTLLSIEQQAMLRGTAEASAGVTTNAVAPTLRIYPAAHTVYRGVPFNVDVMIDNATHLGGFEFTLDYDPAVLQAMTASLGPFLGSTGRAVIPRNPDIDQMTGSIAFGGFSIGSADGPSGTGTLATITFMPITNATNSPLAFIRGQVTDEKGNAQDPTLQSGIVTIADAPYSVRLPAIMR